MGLLPDDRKAEGKIIADLSVRENIILALQAQERAYSRLLPMSKQIEIADQYIEMLQIKTASRETLIKQLSRWKSAEKPFWQDGLPQIRNS